MVYYYLEKGMGMLENKKSMFEYGYHTKSLLSMFLWDPYIKVYYS
jgi:hypothetical protein